MPQERTGATAPRPERPRAHRGNPRPAVSRNRRLALWLFGAFAAASVLQVILRAYTDVLWHSQLGYASVLWRTWGLRALVFTGIFALIMLPSSLTLRSIFALGPSQYSSPALREYQERVQPLRRAAVWGLPAFFALLNAAALSSQWKSFAVAFSGESFGVRDPQFGLDVGFYILVLPALRAALSAVTISVVLMLLSGAVGFYIFGHVAFRRERMFVSRRAQRTVAFSASAVLLVVGAHLWLARYGALTAQNQSWAGALYSDAKALIPGLGIIAIACVIVAAAMAAAPRTQRWRLPVVGAAAVALVGLLVVVLFPWGLQRFVVTPSALSKESPYIAENIKATRAAFGLDQVLVKPYDATTQATRTTLQKDQAALAGIRIMDPNVLSNAFSQLQQYRPYYQFPQQLNVDRYTVDSKTQDALVAVRELNVDGTPDSWFNRHVVYTHGYGFVAASASSATAEGKPNFLQSGIPNKGKLGEEGTFEPRIYFGQKSPDYSIVGSDGSDAPQELDRPQNADAASAEAKTSFSGSGGPSLGNWFNRLAYALKFGSANILLSDGLNSKSQILYDRDPVQRVRKSAPYLTVDSNAYPAVVGGRILWIVDGYTTSASYPYSTSAQLPSEMTAGSALPGAEKANYVRNAVKATVDAYDGSVTLYAWDEDPILKAWQRVYPGTLKPRSEMSQALLEHIRYPQGQFKLQRTMLERYHVTDPGRLFNGDDQWAVPDGAQPGSAEVTPSYLSATVPGSQEPQFSLTTPFISNNVAAGSQRDVMYGYLMATSDTAAQGGSNSSLTLLELPRNTVVPGPAQAETRFNSDPSVSTELNLLRTGASEVITGTTLPLPVGNGILYVQPVYVQAKSGIQMPTLRRILVGFGDEVGFAPDLKGALEQIFQDGASSSASGSSSPSASSAVPGVRKHLQEASAAMEEGQQALAKGDFTAYGKAQEKLKSALEAALAAEEKAGKGKADSAK